MMKDCLSGLAKTLRYNYVSFYAPYRLAMQANTERPSMLTQTAGRQWWLGVITIQVNDYDAWRQLCYLRGYC